MKLVYPSLILLLCAFGVSIPSFSQVNDCGNNAGFEAGTVAGWVCTYGSYGSGPCPSGTCPAFNMLLNNTGVLNPSGVNAALGNANDRHVIVTGAGTDPNSNNTVPVVAPGGGVYSFRLGNANTGGTTDGYAQAEGAKLTFPVTSQNAGFTYRYAAFIEDPGHNPEEQPRFEIIVTDAQGNQVPCGYYKVIAGSNPGCPGTSNFQTGAGAWKYSNWTNVGLDLTNYIGQNISIEFRTADCYPGNGNKPCMHNGPGSHSAYVYIDAYCQPLSISAPFVCTSAGSIQICAPAGYLNYSWPAGQAGISGSPTTQCVTVNNPVIGTVYNVNMTSVTGCPVSTTVALQGTNAFTSDTTVCAGAGNVPLNVSTSTGGNYTYAWTGPNGFNANIQSPLITIPTSTTTYSVTVTSAAGCSVAKIMTVNVLPKPAITISPNASMCSGNSISLSASGGVTYSWSPASGLSNAGIANPVATPGQTTTYSVTITNASGCKNTAFATLVINPPPTLTISPAASLCIGSNASLTSSGGSVYSWSPSTGLSNAGISNPIANPTATTTYNVFVTDANGCSNSASVTLTVNPLPLISVSPASSVCSGSSRQLSASGGNTYSWTPSAGLNNPNSSNPLAGPSSATTYTVFVTNTNGCKNNASSTVTVNALPIVSVSPDIVFCKGGTTQLSASGGVSYAWSPSTGLSNPNISNPVSTPNSNVNYTVTVTGANGCTNTASTIVTVHPLPSINLNPNPGASICKGSSVQLNASGGVIYSWSPTTGLNNSGIANPVASPTIATSYSVFVTDANGCVNNATTNIAINPFATVNVSPDASICAGENVQVTSSTSGSATYTWTPATGLSNSGISNPIANPTATTNYTVSVTNSNGCTGSSTTTIIVNPLPVVSVIPDQSVCNGLNVQLTSSGGTTYSWMPASGLSNPSISNPVASTNSTTTYSLLVSDANGCTGNASVKVTVNPTPNISLSPDATICNGSAVQLTASGGTVYTWSPSTGLSDSAISNPVASPTATTIYLLSVLDGNGCSNSASVKVTVNQFINVNVSPDATVCAGTVTQLTSSGGINYTWSPGIGLDNPNISNPIASPSLTTTYSVHVTDANGCSGNSAVTVNVNQLPVVNISPDVSICNGSSVQLTSSGGTIFSWTPASGLNDSTISNPVAAPSVTTTYSLVVTDVNNCNSAATVTISIPGPPLQNASSTDVSCKGANDGTASAAATGGVPGYFYLWSNSATGSSISGLSPGTYSVTVTDAIGCTAVSSVNVNEPPPMVLNFPRHYYICDEGAGVTLTASGGTTYLWTPGADLSDSTAADPYATPFVTTTYTVTVSTGSCFDTAHVTVHLVSAPAAPPVTQNNDTLFVPSGFVSYQWYYEGSPIPGATTNFFLALQSGHYSVYLTDLYGCRVITASTNIITSISSPFVISGDGILIYPNPSGNWFEISGLKPEVNSTIEIFNVLGERILEQKMQALSSNLNPQTVRMDISSLANGVYLIRIKSKNKSEIARLVKE